MAALLRLAGPIVVSQLGAIAMSTTDTLMVGPLGAASLGAAGIGSAVFMAMLVVCTGTLMGMTPVLVRVKGAAVCMTPPPWVVAVFPAMVELRIVASPAVR